MIYKCGYKSCISNKTKKKQSHLSDRQLKQKKYKRKDKQTYRQTCEVCFHFKQKNKIKPTKNTNTNEKQNEIVTECIKSILM